MRLARAALLLVVAAATGCALWASDDAPRPAALIVAPGERFTISLEANHSTGFSWQLAKPLAENVVTLVETTYETPPGAPPGAPGKELWTFEAVAPGWTSIDFAYRRPWEENLAPARLASYSVDVRAGDAP
ncbi:MAG TPA: protease inhibitor I42 family protein [Candidatus Binatia bacterium]